MRRRGIGLIVFALLGVVASVVWIAAGRTGAPARQTQERGLSITRLTPLAAPSRGVTDGAGLATPEGMAPRPSYDIAGRVITRVNVGRKFVALTFDDGPSRNISKILATLDRYRAKGTFFIVSSRITTHSNLVQAIVTQGSEVGNHTDTHVELDGLSAAGIGRELDRNQEAVAQILGAKPTLMRPPVGKYDEAVVEAAKKRNLAVVLWSVHGQDTGPARARELADRIVGSARPGDIILMHEMGVHSLEALPMVLQRLRAKGYSFVTVSELLASGNLP